MPHIYTPSIQASSAHWALTLGPTPPSLPTANTRLPTLGRKWNKVRAHRPQVTLTQGESAASRPNTRKETHAIPTTHTRREAALASLRP